MLKPSFFFIIFSFFLHVFSSPASQFEVFISKDIFLNETINSICSALINQTLINQIPILGSNTSISLLITKTDVSISEVFISNLSTFDSQSMYLKNSSLKMNFSINYTYQGFEFNNILGDIALKDFDMKLEYHRIEDLLRIRASFLLIDFIDISFQKNTTNSDILISLIKENEIVISSLLSSQINQYFDLHYTDTVEMLRINDIELWYYLNLTNVGFSEKGLVFQEVYSIYDQAEIGAFFKGFHGNLSINSIINSTRNLKKNLEGNSKRNPASDANSINIPLSFFQDLILKAHKDHFFSYFLNETNTKINGFSFFIGDLVFIMPTIAESYYPDTRVDIHCESNDDSPPTLQFSEVSQIEIAYRIKCSINTNNEENPEELLSFDTFLHPLVNMTLDKNNLLKFVMNSIRQEGDNFYHDSKYPIAGKRGKDIANYLIGEAFKNFQTERQILGVLGLPMSEEIVYTMKMNDRDIEFSRIDSSI